MPASATVLCLPPRSAAARERRLRLPRLGLRSNFPVLAGEAVSVPRRWGSGVSVVSEAGAAALTRSSPAGSCWPKHQWPFVQVIRLSKRSVCPGAADAPRGIRSAGTGGRSRGGAGVRRSLTKAAHAAPRCLQFPLLLDSPLTLFY